MHSLDLRGCLPPKQFDDCCSVEAPVQRTAQSSLWPSSSNDAEHDADGVIVLAASMPAALSSHAWGLPLSESPLQEPNVCKVLALQSLQQESSCQPSCVSLQAAGRVWRDGQKKRVYVYRFLATGSIEEKVSLVTCLLSCAS